MLIKSGVFFNENLAGIIKHASFSGQCVPGALDLKRKEEKTKHGKNNSSS